MRLIDADVLIENLKNYAKEDEQKGGVMIACGSFVQGLAVACKLADTAEVVDPVKHGHWMESKCLDDCFWVCSCCKFPSQATAANKLYVYCPNCGAKMEVKRND